MFRRGKVEIPPTDIEQSVASEIAGPDRSAAHCADGHGCEGGPVEVLQCLAIIRKFGIAPDVVAAATRESSRLGDVDRVSGLRRKDAGHLPTLQQVARQHGCGSTAFAKWQ